MRLQRAAWILRREVSIEILSVCVQLLNAHLSGLPGTATTTSSWARLRSPSWTRIPAIGSRSSRVWPHALSGRRVQTLYTWTRSQRHTASLVLRVAVAVEEAAGRQVIVRF